MINKKNREVLIQDSGKAAHREEINNRLIFAAEHNGDELFKKLESSASGKTEVEVIAAREKYGLNKVESSKKDSVAKRLFDSFINPFTIILIVLAIVSLFTDIVMSAPDDKDFSAVIIITTMVVISGVLRFVQETRSGNSAEKLLEMIETTTNIQRVEAGREEIAIDEVVVGDIVYLSAGDMIPADIRILSAKDLFISQSALTGESEAIEKTYTLQGESSAITEYSNLAFMGSDVISGTAVGIVVATGVETIFGEIASVLDEKPPMTSFEEGVNSVSWVLIKFMLAMLPIVLFLNGFTKGDWMKATLFAVSIAVGLTPEMLPMIVTTSLAKGAMAMSKEKVIIKNLNSIQSLGSIDILCSDKTGTLTMDKVILQYHLNIHGDDDSRVLRHAFLNSYFQTGLKNLMDLAIINKTREEQALDPNARELDKEYVKVDEIPFDFERRRMSVVVEDANKKTQMITKGAVEEMLKISSFVELDGKVEELTDDRKAYIMTKVDELNENGMRVLAVAQKTNPSPVGEFSVADENEMVLIGYLAFLDPPKESTEEAIAALNDHGVNVKVITGDNEKVTAYVCKQVGIHSERIILGEELENMTDDEIAEAATHVNIFAKISPMQKARIVQVLKDKGHVVGFLGDGINDAAAMKVADVGISVDTAVDIAKESADVILLEKDLMALEKGIIEGRITYANMIKYIKMTASSNFGNVFSVLIASAFLPFLPMESIHLILLNLIYDISCIAIPWDNVDADFLKKPRNWDASSVSKFMLWIGPTSSVFDIVTYAVMYFIIAPMVVGGQYHTLADPAMKAMFVAVFQSGWFIESMWSQTLVIHMIRTPKIPFIQSRASAELSLLTMLGILILTIIPFTPVGHSIGLASLPMVYFAYLIAIVFGYMVLVTIVKKLYIKKYGELL